MTSAAISSAQAEMADSSAAAKYIADGCLLDGPVRRVGLELEAHCHDPADPYRRPSWDEIAAGCEDLHHGIVGLEEESRILCALGQAEKLLCHLLRSV